MDDDPLPPSGVINCHKCTDFSINNSDDSKDYIPISQEISGDLICMKCGQVLQSNSQLTFDSSFGGPQSSTKNETYLRSKSSDSDLNLRRFTPRVSYPERCEVALHALARKLISSFALKASYEDEALDLMTRYWEQCNVKLRYGMPGNRLLIASLFLLARRDHLAVNLSLLAATIDVNPIDCGAYFEALVAINPTLRALAKASDFVPRSLDLLVNILANQHQVVVFESNLHSLQAQSIRIAGLLEDSETGASRISESIALASVWITLSAILLHSPVDLQAAVKDVCDSASLAFNTVKSRHVLLLDILLERATLLLPSSFSLKLTRPKKVALLLSNLSNVI